jgi:hypothetical protein
MVERQVGPGLRVGERAETEYGRLHREIDPAHALVVLGHGCPDALIGRREAECLEVVPKRVCRVADSVVGGGDGDPGAERRRTQRERSPVADNGRRVLTELQVLVAEQRPAVVLAAGGGGLEERPRKMFNGAGAVAPERVVVAKNVQRQGRVSVDAAAVESEGAELLGRGSSTGTVALGQHE